jgi:hypothetical protein
MNTLSTIEYRHTVNIYVLRFHGFQIHNFTLSGGMIIMLYYVL